ncbi:hypothetical protein GCM10028805_36600 [Spirosoma harenae]
MFSITFAVAQQTPTLDETQEWIIRKLKVNFQAPYTSPFTETFEEAWFNDNEKTLTIKYDISFSEKGAYLEGSFTKTIYLNRIGKIIVKSGDYIRKGTTVELISDGTGVLVKSEGLTKRSSDCKNCTFDTKYRNESDYNFGLRLDVEDNLGERMKKALLDMKKHYGGVTKVEKY